MEISSSMLMFNVKTPIQVGGLKMNVLHQVSVYRHGGKITKDIDFIDQCDVTYLDVPLDNSYEAWRKFVNFHKELGIDFDKLVNEASSKVFDETEVDLLVADMLSGNLGDAIK